jgi:ankyrin repeat protein
MACNLKPVKLIILIPFFIVLMMPAQRVNAQISVIDTSEYLPFIYHGALEYNMMSAAEKGYAGEVSRMLKMGAEIDIHTVEGYTALIFAVANFRLSVVEILLAANADPNAVTEGQESPLFIAVRNLDSPLANHYRDAGLEIDSIGLLIIERLIKFGADLNFQDKNGATPLNFASIHGNFSAADLLLFYGADIDKKSRDGSTPLMSAIWSGYANVADLLVQNGANLEARDGKGFTPFLIAAQNGDTLILRLLKDQGVNIYEKTNDNWDALDIAIRSGQTEGVKWLLKYGNKWNDPERKIVNYYNVAANYGRKDMFALLNEQNITKGYRFHLNQIDVSISGKLAFWDNYSCFSFGFKEPKSNFGIIAGFDTKLWYTRILLKGTENHVYIQYYDKSSYAWAGIYKDISLTNYLFRSNLLLSCSLTGGYFFGNKYKGTDIAPEPKFKVSPGLTLKIERKNRVIFTGLELMTTGYSGMFPVWMRVGFSKKIFFDESRSEGKNIKWY